MKKVTWKMRYVVALKAMARWSIVLILAGMLVSVVGWSWIPYLPSYTQRSLQQGMNPETQTFILTSDLNECLRSDFIKVGETPL